MKIRVKNITVYLYRHRFVRYLFVGGTTFLIDFGILYFLKNNLQTTITFSTSVAYWISISYNFLLNRYWTFEAREKEDLKRHITIYMFLLIGNYFFTLIFVAIISNYIYFLFTKALAVAIQMTWTYYIYRDMIFYTKPRIKL